MVIIIKKKIIFSLLGLLLIFILTFFLNQKLFKDTTSLYVSRKDIIKKDSIHVLFKSESCKYCRALIPVVNEYNKSQSVPIYFYDIDGKEKTLNEYDIEYVPTIIFFEKGKEVSRFDDYVDYEKVYYKGVNEEIKVDKKYVEDKLTNWITEPRER